MLKSMFILLLLTIIDTFVNYQLIAKTFTDEQVNTQIFTMNTDGSNIHRVTNIPVAG